jgi:cytochrome c oxidase subunit 4
MIENSAPAAEHPSGPGHIVPLRVLVAVWVALLVLTIVTVAAVRVDLGKLNLWIALVIATVKGTLVALYFMHLRYDRPFYGIVFIAALLFVMLFAGLAMMDTAAYLPEMIPGYAPGLER